MAATERQPKAKAPSAAPVEASQPSQPSVIAGAPQRVATTTANLLPPEPMGNQYATEDALRSDLPGLSFRIPGVQSEVRFWFRKRQRIS